jgi:ribose/xylose/arabinose/galactoside ABC-type transport system permease subunit
MNFIEFVKKNLMDYFIIVTGVTVAIAVLGINFDKEAMFGYEAYFSPLIIGAVAVLPSFIMYSRVELSFQQMLWRRILHFIALVTILVVFGLMTGLLDSVPVTVSFVFSILMVYLFVNLIQWMIDSKTAKKINQGLRRIQE